MAKDTFYFTHDYNARNDPKMVNLQIRHGMVGVGVYWCIIEMLYEEYGRMKLEYERISFVLRTDIECIKSVLNDFDLFVIDGDYFYSKSVIERLERRNEKSVKARESVTKRWEKYERNTNVSKNDTIKERKEKESKGNNIDNILKGEFENFRKIYGGNKRGLDTEFNNLKKKHKDWKQIIPILKPNYEKQLAVRKQKKDRGEFVPEHKHLQTYINQRCWEEEITLFENPQKMFEIPKMTM